MRNEAVYDGDDGQGQDMNPSDRFGRNRVSLALMAREGPGIRRSRYNRCAEGSHEIVGFQLLTPYRQQA